MECPPSGVLLWYDKSVSGWADGHLVTHQPQENLSATGHTVNSAQSLLEVSLASEKAHGLAVAVCAGQFPLCLVAWLCDQKDILSGLCHLEGAGPGAPGRQPHRLWRQK